MPTITWAKKKNIENLYNIAGPYLGRRKCVKKHCFYGAFSKNFVIIIKVPCCE